MGHVFTGVVLNMDGEPDLTGDVITNETEVHILEEKVPVTLNFNESETVGQARIFRDGNQLKYEIEVDEKFSKELYKQLVPCIGGSTKRRVGKKIMEATVRSIGLASGNADPRIKKLE